MLYRECLAFMVYEYMLEGSCILVLFIFLHKCSGGRASRRTCAEEPEEI